MKDKTFLYYALDIIWSLREPSDWPLGCPYLTNVVCMKKFYQSKQWTCKKNTNRNISSKYLLAILSLALSFVCLIWAWQTSFKIKITKKREESQNNFHRGTMCQITKKIRYCIRYRTRGGITVKYGLSPRETPRAEAILYRISWLEFLYGHYPIPNNDLLSFCILYFLF